MQATEWDQPPKYETYAQTGYREALLCFKQRAEKK